MTIGYARVSTSGQNLDGQCDSLRQAGCERIYSEKISGAKAQRPELERMLDTLREGDTVVITELTRLGRSVKELFAIIERVHEAGASIKSLRETWLDTTTPQGNLLFTIFAGLSQFERDLIRQRTKDGLEAARTRGGGRPKAASGKIETALKMYDSKLHTISEITAATGISRATLYRAIGERKSNKGNK
ncbi:recombinase family protein [Muribaculum intestinale]|uniref:recombinase family protein n=1 Tax=Muribaculum intestinale TaxID=1796646 RepID=UPI003F668B9D